MVDTNVSSAAPIEAAFQGEQRLRTVRNFLEQDSKASFNPLALLLRVLRGRWLKVALLVIIFASLFGAAGFFAVSPIYQSQGMVRISARESTILYADADDARLKLFDAFVSGEVTYLGSRPVLQRALKDVQDGEPPSPAFPHNIATLSDMITVSRSKGLIIVTGRSKHADVAVAAVNAVIGSYIALHEEQESGRQSYREKELVVRESDLLTRLEGINERALKVGGEYGMDSLLKAHIAKIAQIEELEQRTDEVASTIDQLEAGGVTNNADMGDMEIKRATLLDRALADMIYDRTKRAAALETLLQRYQPNTRQVIQAEQELSVLDQAIDERREQIATLGRTGALTATGEGDRQQSTAELKSLLTKLQKRLDLTREEAKTLNGKLVELRFLQEERTGVRVLLDETRRVLDQIRVESRNSLPGVVEVLSQGSYPDSAIEDKRPQIAILGAGFGGGMAFSLFFLLCLLRPTLRYSDDLESTLEVAPLSAAVPRTKDLGNGQFGNAVNRLRNAIQLLPIRHNEDIPRGRIIGVTGMNDKSGSTVLCGSLGISFAKSGLRTLIVDADLVTPDLTACLNGSEKLGWRDLLGSQSETVNFLELEDELYFLPSGQAKRVQDDALSLPRLRSALSRIAKDMDLVLLDMGPYSKRMSAGLIASQADLTVVVSRPGEPLPQLRRILGQLDRIAPGALCQVFNFAPRRDPEIAALSQ